MDEAMFLMKGRGYLTTASKEEMEQFGLLTWERIHI